MAFNDTQIQGAKAALALWQKIANINFVEVPDTGDGGQIRLGTANLSNDVISTRAFYPQGNHPISGDIWLNNQRASNFDQTPGSFGFSKLLGAVGMATGLKIPGNYDIVGDSLPSPYLSVAEDNWQYAVMSLNFHPYYGSSSSPQTPLLYDIAALQALYGANMTTRTGDDLYQWNTDEVFIEAIWDAGGVDTISAANQTRNAVIDLQAGRFSSIGANGSLDAKDNLAIAYGVVIENAIGGNGNDLITGNAANNRIDGSAGDDTLMGGAGDDTLDGGSGNDSMRGGSGNDSYTVDSTSDTIVEQINEGIDTVYALSNYLLSDNLENLVLTGNSAITGQGNSLDNVITGNAINNYLYGGDGMDRVTGDAGNDYLFGQAGDDALNGNNGRDWLVGEVGDDFLSGGAGSDRLIGGLGDDVITGGTGSDRLTGGADADQFVFDGLRQGMDVITDFNALQGDRLVISSAGFGESLQGGRLAARQFTIGARATNEMTRFIYNPSTGQLFFDADGTGSEKQVQFAQLSNRATLTSRNIFVATITTF